MLSKMTNTRGTTRSFLLRVVVRSGLIDTLGYVAQGGILDGGGVACKIVISSYGTNEVDKMVWRPSFWKCSRCHSSDVASATPTITETSHWFERKL
jgi:hypothetical protein